MLAILIAAMPKTRVEEMRGIGKDVIAKIVYKPRAILIRS
jgi:hypothetical protein